MSKSVEEILTELVVEVRALRQGYDAVRRDLDATNSALAIWAETQVEHGRMLAEVIELLAGPPGDGPNPLDALRAEIEKMIVQCRAVRAGQKAVQETLGASIVRGAQPRC